jgi:hypothetical protein
MCWWSFFTLYFGLMPKMHKIPKWVSMDNQTCCFGKIISFMCDLHLNINILNPLNIYFLLNGFKKWILCLATLSLKISRLWNFCMIWYLIKFIQCTCIFIKGGMFFLYKKFEINCMTLCIPFDSLKKRYFRHLILLICKTQKDIYIVSKLILNVSINLIIHHFIYWHTTIHYNYNNVRF